LLLDDKLKEIAKTLGKVDEHGDIAEDLRAQILGQLSERLSYESLYSQALSDPELKRTRLELKQPCRMRQKLVRSSSSFSKISTAFRLRTISRFPTNLAKTSLPAVGTEDDRLCPGPRRGFDKSYAPRHAMLYYIL